jgi:hypothetical protein
VANAGDGYQVNEGATLTLDASLSSDPDGDALTYEWDLNADGVFDDATVVNPQTSFPDDGQYPVSVRVTDPSGAQSVATAQVTVLNVAPVIAEPINLPNTPMLVGSTINASATFTDPGLLDTHTALWDWGDGTNTAGIVNGNNVSGSHAYTKPGLYTVILSMSDDDGGSDLAMYQYVVIYDPKSGFATGFGWIKSSNKRAQFGFVAYYLPKDASTPRGSVVFQDPSAKLNFVGTKFEWLIVNGSKAQIKGTGFVNRTGGYSFIISVIDGRPDKFRIKIWDKTTGEVIYDNQPGAADDANPTTKVQGGSIVIYK